MRFLRCRQTNRQTDKQEDRKTDMFITILCSPNRELVMSSGLKITLSEISAWM